MLRRLLVLAVPVTAVALSWGTGTAHATTTAPPSQLLPSTAAPTPAPTTDPPVPTSAVPTSPLPARPTSPTDEVGGVPAGSWVVLGGSAVVLVAGLGGALALARQRRREAEDESDPGEDDLAWDDVAVPDPAEDEVAEPELADTEVADPELVEPDVAEPGLPGGDVVVGAEGVTRGPEDPDHPVTAVDGRAPDDARMDLPSTVDGVDRVDEGPPAEAAGAAVPVPGGGLPPAGRSVSRDVAARRRPAAREPVRRTGVPRNKRKKQR